VPLEELAEPVHGTAAQARLQGNHLARDQRADALPAVKLLPEEGVAVALHADLARSAHGHLLEEGVQVELGRNLVELGEGPDAGLGLALHHVVQTLGVERVDARVGAAGDAVLEVANQLLGGVIAHAVWPPDRGKDGPAGIRG
jgi:hypothetical protein